MAESSKKTDSRIIVGLIFILIGAYLLLYNLDLLPFVLPDYVLSWKTLLIAIGLLLVGTRENKGGGVTLIIVGGVFLVADVLDVTIGELIREVWLFWPAIFIIIGIALLMRRSQEKKSNYDPRAASSVSEDDYFELTAVLSGNKKTAYSRNFQGAKVTALLGGADLDFTEAKLAPGTYEIDVFAFMGGVTFIIPNNWNVRVEITPILGGFEDKRKFAQHYTPGAESTLIIKGLVVLGGGEIEGVR
ncbi:MAG: LiaF transmembrane domain-containing protein [Cyclobacteriaceae bacterium]